MKQILNNIYWFFYRLTPQGKKAYMFKQALQGLEVSRAKGSLSKLNIIGQANKILKPRKILTFHKGSTISKSKKTNHEVVEQVRATNKEVLSENNLKITKKGKFANA